MQQDCMSSYRKTDGDFVLIYHVTLGLQSLYENTHLFLPNFSLFNSYIFGGASLWLLAYQGIWSRPFW